MLRSVNILILAGAVLAQGNSGLAQTSASLRIGGTVSAESTLKLALVKDLPHTGGNERFSGVLTARSNHPLGYEVSIDRLNWRSGARTGAFADSCDWVSRQSLVSVSGGKTGPKGISQTVTVLKSMTNSVSSDEIVVVTIAAN